MCWGYCTINADTEDPISGLPSRVAMASRVVNTSSACLRVLDGQVSTIYHIVELLLLAILCFVLFFM